VGVIAGALERYLLSAAPRLQAGYAADLRLGGGRLLGNLRMAVAEEEKSAEFGALRRVCLADATVAKSRFYSSPVTEDAWGRALGAYLRNTGAYLSVARSEQVEHHGLAERLVKEAARTAHTVTYYAMLEGVDLGTGEAAWGNYRLVYLNPTSLGDVLSLQTRALFLDDDPADLRRLAHHWFVVASERVATGIKGARRRLQRHWSSRLTLHAGEFSAPVEDALATLALYDWQPEWAEDDRPRAVEKQLGWMGFRVPVVFETGGDLLCQPRPIPDTSEVALKPVAGPDREEIGEGPEQSFLELDAAQTQRLQEFVAELQACRDRLASLPSADFLRVATDAMLKALLSRGMEQLLWHITAIGAVLGEVKAGESTTSLLARRLASVLASTKPDRNDVSKGFSELYAFRSDLVHGRRPGKGAFRGHLTRAREFSRSVTVWALRAFACLHEAAAADAALAPERGDLLRLVDLTEQQWQKLAQYAGIVPGGFPHVPGWLR